MANKAPNKRGQGSRRKLLEMGLAQFHANGYAATGVDLISIGRITNSAPVLDIGLDIGVDSGQSTA